MTDEVETQETTSDDVETLSTDRPKTARERLEEHKAGEEMLLLEVKLEELKEGGANTDSDEYRQVKADLRAARMRYRALRDAQVVVEDHKGRPFAVDKGRADVVVEAFALAAEARNRALEAAEAAESSDDDGPDAVARPGATEAGAGANHGSAGGDAE